ncbi:hypothetical protein L6452_36060 [Arctium lappa]|uniref:Uncharacterized protein n=1 Tax=Arctium lappa TaxID=4217 RepID=A0ACB8Y847_ARCLA|nr:hypothetical protein L6452_36060 [Arctium lappa]
MSKVQALRDYHAGVEEETSYFGLKVAEEANEYCSSLVGLKDSPEGIEGDFYGDRRNDDALMTNMGNEVWGRYMHALDEMRERCRGKKMKDD